MLGAPAVKTWWNASNILRGESKAERKEKWGRWQFQFGGRLPVKFYISMFTVSRTTKSLSFSFTHLLQIMGNLKVFRTIKYRPIHKNPHNKHTWSNIWIICCLYAVSYYMGLWEERGWESCELFRQYVMEINELVAHKKLYYSFETAWLKYVGEKCRTNNENMLVSIVYAKV